MEDQNPLYRKKWIGLEKWGIIRKGLTGYSSPVLLVKRKQQNLYRVVTDFRVLNERLVRVNHAFPIVRDCLEAIGASKCEVMSVLDLRDAYHTLPQLKNHKNTADIAVLWITNICVFKNGNGNVMQSSIMATVRTY